MISILLELTNLNNSSSGEFTSSLLLTTYFLGALTIMFPLGVLAKRLGNMSFIGFRIVLTSISISISGLHSTQEKSLYFFNSMLIESSACGAFFPSALAAFSKYRDV